MTTTPPREIPEPNTDPNLRAESLVLPEFVKDLKLICAGGMGAVYEAKHAKTGERLAVKVLLPQHLEDEISKKRFIMEAETITSLNNKHIVRNFHYGAPDNKAPYMVMEFIEGTTLARRIREDGPLSQDLATDIFIQIADGLRHAHSKGVLHRDIKPSNIMLTSTTDGSMSVKLVDFGMAKYYRDEKALQEHLTLTGTIVGTPLFMSPEQCLNKPLDARSDIYCLGCVMYLALTGRLAIDGNTVVELFSRHVSTAADLSIVEEPYKTIIGRCLEKNPDDRYQTAEKLMEDLQRIQADRKPKFQLTGKQRYSLNKTVFTIVCLILGFALGFVIMMLPEWLGGH